MCLKKKKKSQSRAVSLRCIHTDETGKRSHENPCCFDTCIWSQLCFARCPGCRWFEWFRAGQVSFEDCHRPSRPISVRHEQSVLFVNNIYIFIEKKSIHNYTWNMWKIIFVKNVNDVTFRLAQPKELCEMTLIWKKKKKSWQDGYPISQTTRNRNRELNV